MRACHAAGPGSIPGRWGFLRGFSSPVRQMSGSFRPQGPRISFGHHYHHQLSFITGANDLRCWRALKPQIYIHTSVFCPRTGPSLQSQAPRLQFCLKAGLPLQTHESRLQFYYRWICAVASRCFLYPTLNSASEQTLKDLKRSSGTNEEVRRVDLANWALRTSPKFTTGAKYQFHQGFWPDQRSRNPSHPSPP